MSAGHRSPHASVPALADKTAWLPRVDAAIAAHLPILTAAPRYAWASQTRPNRLIDYYGSEDRAEAIQPATLAMVACNQGRLQTAYRLASAAVNGRQPEGVDDPVIDARLVLAEVLFEHNELRAAEQQVAAALQLARAEEASYPIWALELEVVRVLTAQQHLAEALNRLGHLRQAETGIPHLTTCCKSSIRSRLAAASTPATWTALSSSPGPALLTKSPA